MFTAWAGCGQKGITEADYILRFPYPHTTSPLEQGIHLPDKLAMLLFTALSAR